LWAMIGSDGEVVEPSHDTSWPTEPKQLMPPLSTRRQQARRIRTFPSFRASAISAAGSFLAASSLQRCHSRDPRCDIGVPRASIVAQEGGCQCPCLKALCGIHDAERIEHCLDARSVRIATLSFTSGSSSRWKHADAVLRRDRSASAARCRRPPR